MCRLFGAEMNASPDGQKSTDEGTRTPNPLIRSQMRYPLRHACSKGAYIYVLHENY